MHYRIVGADRASGDDRDITVEARDEDEAVRKANESGIMPSQITPIQPIGGMPFGGVTRRHFRVEVVTEGALGTLLLGASRIQAHKLEAVLNRYGAEGWDLSFMVVEKRRFLLLWTREAAIVTFSKVA